MKVIFLDFDGVLNSDRYNRIRDHRTQGSLDEAKLPVLRRIVEETGAVIVLSTSWRRLWSPDPTLCDPRWQECGDALARHALTVRDRTPDYEGNNRDREISDWLADHEGEVESFVILDDVRFGWGDLSPRVVRTDPACGLTESLADKAISLLGRKE